MKPRIGDIMFDAAHPAELAKFWAQVLHYEIQEISENWASIIDPEGRGSRLCFQQTMTPKAHKNRVHFDVFVENEPSEVERIQQLGAAYLRAGAKDGVTWTVMLDPEGNEFCVQRAPAGA